MKRHFTNRISANRVTAVVIGGGHNGLAMSRCLAQQAIDHVVLERGEVANSWRTERWDSLRLLTPNWQFRLPDYRYDGNSPNDYMSMPEVVAAIDRYAVAIDAPVRTHTTVVAVNPTDHGYEVVTDQGVWRCRAVVLASGGFNIANVPAVGAALPPSIRALTAMEYKRPEQLDEGEVLVVGASATGLQLAREIHDSGRPVTLAVGEHVRMPRIYRGCDIQCWMEIAGILDQEFGDVDDIERARRVSSPQLIGSPERESLDLNALDAIGVNVVGRLSGFRGGKLLLSGSLANQCKLADLKMNRLLRTIDDWIDRNGMKHMVVDAETCLPTRVSQDPSLTLEAARFRSVIWATGFRPDYSWLHVPVLDRKGRLRHEGGVVAAPGMYVLGLPFLRRRKSSFICGSEYDAVDLGAHLSQYVRSESHRMAG